VISPLILAQLIDSIMISVRVFAFDITVIRRAVSLIFTHEGHRVIEAENGAEALRFARQFAPDLIVLDVNMPKMGGIEALHELRGDARFARTAIVMLTGDHERKTILSAIQEGASDYILKDNLGNIRQKLQTYLRLLSKPADAQRTVLIVDDTRLMRHIVSRVFLANGHQVIEGEDGEKGIALAVKHVPDLIVLDVYMPKMDGVEVLRRIRANPKLTMTPVVMLTAERDVPTVKEIMALGVDDYIVKENAVEIENRLRNYLNLM
jgi:two-component system alkaline phosphatase synthesis response regulator PhoP